jgi:lysophospholipid acyltransferase (LPLAT)-like uncharacterized protein
MAFWPPALALHLYYRTLRIEVEARTREILQSTPSPRMLVVWHNRSLVMPEVFRRYFDPPKLNCLISASRLAAWEVAFFRTMRLRIIRGSTTRRSVHAVREMIRELRQGHDVGISPDGPSGPLFSFQTGALAIARKAQVPLLFLTAHSRTAFRASTWDRHFIPLPGSRLLLIADCIQPHDSLWELSDRDLADQLRMRFLSHGQ